jgi:hypothetical protein
VGLSLQSRAAGFGSGRRRGALYGCSESRSLIGSLRVGEPTGAVAVVRARGSKHIVPLRAKKSSGGTVSSPLLFFPFVRYQTGAIRVTYCRFSYALFSRFEAIFLDFDRIGYKINLFELDFIWKSRSAIMSI